MKKFSKIVESEDKEKTLDFKGDKSNTTSDDVENLNDLMGDNLSDEIKASIVDGEWEIESIVDINTEPPKDINEAIVINAELGSKPIKMGDFIYITALIHKKGNYIHPSQMGVIKVRIVEIYNTLLILNTLKR
jgi:hypothetical protein